MKTSEKLYANWKAGLWTEVKDRKDGTLALFTTKDKDGNLRCSFWAITLEEAVSYAGAHHGHSKEYIDSQDWEIIRTIHPSELMGPGYEAGQKVRIKPNAKEECEKIGNCWHSAKEQMAKDGFGFIKKMNSGMYLVWNKDRSDSWHFPETALEPYFEDETGVTEVAGVKYRKADIEALVKSAKDLKPLE